MYVKAVFHRLQARPAQPAREHRSAAHRRRGEAPGRGLLPGQALRLRLQRQAADPVPGKGKEKSAGSRIWAG
uniref:Uncharacterized protein n=1 Tax=Macrostomum lignano TaxID=282301 RepID=A0A1I8JME4_9PLAT